MGRLQLTWRCHSRALQRWPQGEHRPCPVSTRRSERRIASQDTHPALGSADPVLVGVSPTRFPPAKPVIEDLEPVRMGVGSKRWRPEHEHWQACQRKRATADTRPVVMVVPGPVIRQHQSVARGSAAIGLDPGEEALGSLVASAHRVTAPRAVQRTEGASGRGGGPGVVAQRVGGARPDRRAQVVSSRRRAGAGRDRARGLFDSGARPGGRGAGWQRTPAVPSGGAAARGARRRMALPSEVAVPTPSEGSRVLAICPAVVHVL
jgi:hypothetical protein